MTTYGIIFDVSTKPSCLKSKCVPTVTSAVVSAPRTPRCSGGAKTHSDKTNQGFKLKALFVSFFTIKFEN